MPRVPFDIVFALRDALFEGLNNTEKSEHSNWVNVRPTSGRRAALLYGKATVFGAHAQPLDAPDGKVLLADGQALLHPVEAEWLEQRLKVTKTSIRVVVDIDAPALTTEESEKISQQRSVLQVVRRVQLAQQEAGQEPNIQLSLAARHLLHFDAIYAHLAGPNNWLRSAELQGNPKLDLVPLCAHQHLAIQHGVKVRFLTGLQHRDLSQRAAELPEDAEREGRRLANVALEKLAKGPAGPILFAGLDVAGAETELLDVDRLRGVMAALATFSESSAWKGLHPLVLRVHAGESYVQGPELSPEDIFRGTQNVDAVLTAASSGSELFTRLCKSGKVVLRIGHATHLDPATQLRDVAKLDVRLEFNPISNAATGVDPTGEAIVLRATALRNALRAWNIAEPRFGEAECDSHIIGFEISTDSNGVMGGELTDNLQLVMKLLAEEPLLVSRLSPKSQVLARQADLSVESPGVAPGSESESRSPSSEAVLRGVRRGSGSLTITELSDAFADIEV